MGRKITQYPNNVSVTPDELSYLDVSEKTGLATYESRKWTLSAFTAWIKAKIGLSSGTLNKVSKFGTDGTLVDSMITDDGTGIGIGASPNSQTKTYIYSEDKRISSLSRSNYTGGNPSIGVGGVAEGNNTGENIGGEFSADNSTEQNIGIRTIASGSTAYLGQFQDGTQGLGKFIKSVSSDGKANWSNITVADVSGAVEAVNGTNNYVAKFSPNGTTIGNSQIQDDGEKIGINSAPNTGSKIYIISNEQAGINLQSNISNINTGIGITTTVQGTNNSANTGITSNAYNGKFSTTGVQGSASSSLGVNKGVEGISSGTSTNIGLRGYAVNGSLNYSIQLQDGTQGTGKFLKSVTTDGKANWANITSSDINDLRFVNDYTSASWNNNSLFINHGLNNLTPSVFCYVDNKLAEFDVLTIDENNLSINKNDNITTPSLIRIGVS